MQSPCLDRQPRSSGIVALVEAVVVLVEDVVLVVAVVDVGVGIDFSTFCCTLESSLTSLTTLNLSA